MTDFHFPVDAGGTAESRQGLCQHPQRRNNEGEHDAAHDSYELPSLATTEFPVSATTIEDENKAKRKYREKIILGLMLPFVLQALDVTM
jgi:hypothetical protein